MPTGFYVLLSYYSNDIGYFSPRSRQSCAVIRRDISLAAGGLLRWLMRLGRREYILPPTYKNIRYLPKCLLKFVYLNTRYIQRIVIIIYVRIHFYTMHNILYTYLVYIYMSSCIRHCINIKTCSVVSQTIIILVTKRPWKDQKDRRMINRRYQKRFFANPFWPEYTILKILKIPTLRYVYKTYGGPYIIYEHWKVDIETDGVNLLEKKKYFHLTRIFFQHFFFSFFTFNTIFILYFVYYTEAMLRIVLWKLLFYVSLILAIT